MDKSLQAITDTEDFNLDEYAEQVGLTPKKTEKTVKFQPEEVAAVQQAELEKAAMPAPTPGQLQNAKPGVSADNSPGQVAEDFSKGVAKGSARLAQNVYNGVVALGNYVSQFASEGNGKETGDILPHSDLEILRKNENSSDAQKLGQFVGEYGAPVALTMAAGGGALAATAAGAGIDFATLDPHQERMSTLLNEKYPELRTTAVVGNMFAWLGENNPEQEGELEGRAKNALEGIFVGGAVSAVVKGFQGAIKMSRAAGKYLSKGAPAADELVETTAPKILQEEELLAIEAKLGANADEAASMETGSMPILREPTPEELVKLDDAAARVAAGDDAARAEIKAVNEARVETVEVPPLYNPRAVMGVGSEMRVNPHSSQFDNLLLFADNFEAKFVPSNWDEARAAAKQIVGDGAEAEVLAKMFARKPGDAPFTQSEVALLAEKIKPGFDAEYMAAKKAFQEAADDDTDAILRWESAKARKFQLGKIIAGSGSEAGSRLQMQKMFYHLAEAKDYVKQATVVTDAATGEKSVVTKNVIPAKTYYTLRDTNFRQALNEQMVQKFGGAKVIKDQKSYYKQVDNYVEGLEPGKAEVIYKQIEEAEQMGNPEKVAELVSSLARKAMLSSPTSTVSAFIGNAMATLSAASAKYTAVGTNQLYAMGRRVKRGQFQGVLSLDHSASEALSQANDFAEGLFLGWQSFMKGAKTASEGAAVNRFNKVEIRTQPIDPAFWGVDGTTLLAKRMEQAGVAMDNTVGFGEHLLGKTDKFYGSILEYAHLHELAGRKARAAMVEGALDASDLTAVTKFKQEAVLMSSVDEVKEAGKFAQSQVFASPLSEASGTGDARGVVAQGVTWMQNGPVRKFLFPFVRTGYNMMDYSLQHSLLAPVWAYSTTGKALQRGGEEGALAAAKIMNGTAIVGAAGFLAYNGLITGPPPTNPRMRRALEESNKGWQPYSIKVGDTYVSYERMEPMATMLKFGAMTSIVGEYLDERDAHASMHLMAAGLADAFSPEALSDEFVGIMDVVSKMGEFREDAPEAVKKMMVEQAGKFVPAILRDTKRFSDDYKRDTYSTDVMTAIGNMAAAKTPWFSKDLSVQRNLWGEPILEKNNLGPDFLVPLPTSYGAEGTKVKEVLERFARMDVGKPENEAYIKLALSMPSRVFTEGPLKVQMTNEEYERYMIYYSGHMPKEGVAPGKEPAMMTPLKDAVAQIALPVYDMVKGKEVLPIMYDEFMKQITKTVRGYRKHANNMMLMDPEFAARVNKVRQKRLELQDVGF